MIPTIDLNFEERENDFTVSVPSPLQCGGSSNIPAKILFVFFAALHYQ